MSSEHDEGPDSRTPDHLSWPEDRPRQPRDGRQGMDRAQRHPIPVEADPDRQRDALASAFAASGLTVGELWTRYIGVGGNAHEHRLESFLDGLTSLPSFERDLIAQALNENLDDQGLPRSVPYSFAT